MNSPLPRYHRQTLLPGIGPGGQARLAGATVLVMGCGALGTVIADLLARAGVGHLIVVDRDVVELTNLQRQVLFDERDVAERLPKAVAAQRKLRCVNSDVRVSAIVDDINQDNIEELAAGADLLVDGLDNFETRYLANDLAVKTGRPFVYGAAVGTTGMAFTVLPRGTGPSARATPTPCFRCLFDEPPPAGTMPTCETAGVLAAVVGMVANIQVAETIKILTGNADRLRRSLLSLDLWHNEFLELEVAVDADCPCCAKRRFDYLEAKRGSTAVALCGRDAVQIRDRESGAALDLEGIAARLPNAGSVRVNEFILLAELEDKGGHYEITLFRDGRFMVKGTDEPGVARRLFAKFVGS